MFEALPPLLLVIAAAAVYGAGVRAVWRNRARAILPAWRVVCFVIGLAVIAAALVGILTALTRF